MDFLFIVALMPGPNVGRAQHGGSPEGIGLKIRRVARDVVAVFVIDDTGIVGSVRPVARPVQAASLFHKRSIVEELSAGTKMNFSGRGEGREFWDVVSTAGKPIV